MPSIILLLLNILHISLDNAHMRPNAILVFLLTLALSISISYAQNDCGVVDGIGFPVDTNIFTLTQDFAVPSARHQGRYHTGEDWYGGRDNSVGQPIQAAARGRVTLASPTAWGRDGGVVIIEHTFPDGSVYYTQYGHITETDSYSFPSRLACVQMGDVIGAIADARPAPHLHFEVRISGGTNSTTPGAGYISETPNTQDYISPSKFIVNQQTWLSLWHEWHLTIGADSIIDERGPIAPLLTLSDNSVLYLDGAATTLRRATPDGRVLWRIRLDIPAVAIEGWQGSSLLTLSDGTMQLVDVEVGSLGESWRVDAVFTDAPIINGDEVLYPASDNQLLRISADRREVLATYDDVPPFYRAHILNNGNLALLTHDDQFRYYTANGEIITSAQLRARASLASSWQGELLAYTLGGLWQVDSAGEWSLYIEDAPQHSGNGSMHITDDSLYLFNGSSLSAYNPDRTLRWQANTPAINGLTEIAVYDDIVLITSNHGDILLVNNQGGFCNQVRVFGYDAANQWHQLGTDNLLRLAVADQILALDWNTFIRPCNV